MANPTSTIDANELITRLKANGWVWPNPTIVAAVDSTNHSLLNGDPRDGEVLVSHEQTQGRGRGENNWFAPPGTSVLMSIALRPQAPVMAWPWVGVLMSMAGLSAMKRTTDGAIDVALKWPNDLVARSSAPWDEDNSTASQGDSRRKVGGVLSEVSGEVCVVGIGINVNQGQPQLPDQATSVSLMTKEVPTLVDLIAATLLDFWPAYNRWNTSTHPDHDRVVRDEYLLLCETIGDEISCIYAGQALRGLATGVNQWGQLVVQTQSFGELELDSALVSNLRRVG